MKGKKWPWVIVVLLLLLLFGCCGCMMVGLLFAAPSDAMSSEFSDAVAIVQVKGVITSEGGPRGMGVAYADNVIEDLKSALSDPTVAAIVLDVNSPGGGVVASQDIYNALLEADKPIVTSMGDTAASGGYYIAVATQYIVAKSATLTGSIGVIMEFTDISGLLDMVGIDNQVVKTGKYKDSGGSYRPLTDDELMLFQELINESYEDFVTAVAKGRGLTPDEVRSLATGRVYSGRQAVALGLADVEGDRDDAIAIAAELGGISGEPRIVQYQQVDPLFALFGQFTSPVGRSAANQVIDAVFGSGDVPKVMYLYAGP